VQGPLRSARPSSSRTVTATIVIERLAARLVLPTVWIEARSAKSHIGVFVELDFSVEHSGLDHQVAQPCRNLLAGASGNT